MPLFVPPIVSVGMLLTGIGLLGMTAGELPGIPARLGLPRWCMGALAGALVASGLVLGWPPRWARPRLGALLAFGAMFGLLLVAVGQALGWVGDAAATSVVANAINALARIPFGLGAGVAIGGLAFEASRRRHR